MKKQKNRLKRQSIFQSYLMIAPSTILLFVFVIFPLLWQLRWCLFSYRGHGDALFVGFDNFVRVFERSPKYWLSVKNTFIFTFGKLLIEIPLALVLAFILTRNIKGQSFFRTIFFMPSMISVAVMGVVFTYLFAHNTGVVNELLKAIGLKPIKWFAEGSTAMSVLMTASIWANFGLNMIFIMTGIQSISPDLYEAAELDGASAKQQFMRITIPMLGPVLQMVLMNAILGSLKVTDEVLVLTDGRPNGKTEVMMTYIYKQFFQNASAKDYGYGSALTIVTAIILAVLTVVYLKATRESSDAY